MSPRPPSITLGPFWIFSKIRGDIREWIFIIVNDTSDKLFSGVNDTGEKFIAGVINPCYGEITKKPKNFRRVSDTAEKLFTGVNDNADKLFGGVDDTGD